MKRMRIVIIALVALIGIVLLSLLVMKLSKSNSGFASNSSVQEAVAAVDKDDLLAARTLYKKALEDIDDPNALKDIEKKIEDLNMKILFSPLVDNWSTQYTVKPGDTLAKIAKEYGTTTELIMASNDLDSTTIRVGQGLKVTICKFSISVDKSQNTLLLKVGNDIVKTYVVSTGKNNNTPVGTFKIVNKLPNPTWFKTGAVIPAESPENVLGTRWMGFDLKGYGIHGTTAPQDLGKQVTAGCVRMKNDEVEELYTIVPVGTEVTIVD
ncbi:MAG: L,D-transpeptidase family protein [Candidatus Omnitrophota bacterium]